MKRAASPANAAELLRTSMVRRVVGKALDKAIAPDPMGCLVELADVSAKHPGLPRSMVLEAAKLEFKCSLKMHEYLRATRLGDLLYEENPEDLKIISKSAGSMYLLVFRAAFAYVSFDPVTGAVRDDADDGDFLGQEMPEAPSGDPSSDKAQAQAQAQARAKAKARAKGRRKLKNYDSISDDEDWAEIFAWIVTAEHDPGSKPKDATESQIDAFEAQRRKDLISILHQRIAARNYELPIKIWLASLSLGDFKGVLPDLPGLRHKTVQQDLDAAMAKDIDHVPEATARAYRVAREGAALLSRIVRSREAKTTH